MYFALAILKNMPMDVKCRGSASLRIIKNKASQDGIKEGIQTTVELVELNKSWGRGGLPDATVLLLRCGRRNH
jgi:hypothetical protein